MLLYEVVLIVIITIACIAILYPLATRIGLVDVPSDRKHHKGNIPLIGGVAIFISVTLSLVIFDVVLNYDRLVYFIMASFVIIVIGVIDDYYNIGFKFRLVFQIIAVFIMSLAGVEILSLGPILSSNDIQLDLYSTVFTIFAVLGIINSLNFSDGIDGTGGAISVVVFSSVAFLTYDMQGELFTFSVFLIIASLTFLVFNLGMFRIKFYKIFLGDAGSTYLGLAIAWLLISLSQENSAKLPPALTLWIYAVPLMDTVSIMLRRISKRKSPFLPDREHLHHLFLRAGYSDRQSLLIIFSLSGLLSFIGILLHQNNTSERVIFFLFIVIFLIYYFLIRHSWKTIRLIKKN